MTRTLIVGLQNDCTEQQARSLKQHIYEMTGLESVIIVGVSQLLLVDQDGGTDA